MTIRHSTILVRTDFLRVTCLDRLDSGRKETSPTTSPHPLYTEVDSYSIVLQNVSEDPVPV